MKKNLFLSLVIPCYNEAANLELLLKSCHESLGELSDFELILVNNGSADNSATIMEKLEKEYSYLKIVTVINNKGYGHGILEGLKNTSEDSTYVGWTHADLQTKPSDILAAYQKLKGQKEKKVFLKGKRVNRPILDKAFSFGMGVVSSLKTWIILDDINAQPTIFSRSLIDEVKNPPLDFSLDLYFYICAKKYGYAIERIPVKFEKRLHGEGHIISLSARINYSLKTLKYLSSLDI